MDAYPSTAYILGRYLMSQNENIPLRGVFTSSETLHSIQREVIEQAFVCKVFDYYGLAERTIFATECEIHTGYHINLDYGIVETIDQNGPIGNFDRPGRIVTTGLHNWAMPLIRYETSDITTLSSTHCSCGRSFPLMEAITTKAEDIVVTPDGRHISPSVLTHPFKPMHNIKESQISQSTSNHILVKIVRRLEYTDKDTQQLLDGLRERLGTDVSIELDFVSEIPREPSGKFRWIISQVPLGF
jgi:phenylacetate-CoA ligase